MFLYSLGFAFSVACCNFFLNRYSQKTASAGVSYFQSIFSLNFLITFIIGTFSLLLMLKLYSIKQVNLPQAILIMGSLSMLLGSFIGHFFYQQKMNGYDWLLFMLVFAWYIGKFYKHFTA